MRRTKSLSTCYLFALVLAWVMSSTICTYADIYLYIDADGIMHFTNAPTASDRDYRVYIKEKSTYRPSSFYSSDKYDALISQASKQYNVDSRLVKAIIKAESDFNPRAVSKKGAKGLMQLMPENIRAFRVSDPFDPRENIMGGTRYIKRMIKRYGGKLSLAIAAYNAGPENVKKYNNIPPFKETENYVKRVLAYYEGYN